MPRRQFNRRTYHHIGELIEDFRFIWQRRRLLRRTMRVLIPPAFRERLMLAVTQVNRCRYCSFYHSRLALDAGVSKEEIHALLVGSIPEEAPPEESIALAYAQHWAETNANPDPEARQKLVSTYGEEKAQAIELVLRLIRSGNLLGNTFDGWLYRLSFGRLGL